MTHEKYTCHFRDVARLWIFNGPVVSNVHRIQASMEFQIIMLLTNINLKCLPERTNKKCEYSMSYSFSDIILSSVALLMFALDFRLIDKNVFLHIFHLILLPSSQVWTHSLIVWKQHRTQSFITYSIVSTYGTWAIVILPSSSRRRMAKASSSGHAFKWR